MKVESMSNFEVFGNVAKHCLLEYLIYLPSRNETKSKKT